MITIVKFLLLVSICDSFLFPSTRRMSSLNLQLHPRSSSRTSQLEGFASQSQLSNPFEILNNLTTRFSTICPSLERARALVSLGDKFAIEMQQKGYLNLNLTKVEGCISVVKIGVQIEKNNLNSKQDSMIESNQSFDYRQWKIKGQLYGGSDARLTQGILALLSQGLKDCIVSDILNLDGNEIVEKSKLNEVLSQGRISSICMILKTLKNILIYEVSKVNERGDQFGNIVFDHLMKQSNKLSANGVFNEKEVAVLLSGGVDSSVALQLALNVKCVTCGYHNRFI